MSVLILIQTIPSLCYSSYSYAAFQQINFMDCSLLLNTLRKNKVGCTGISRFYYFLEKENPPSLSKEVAINNLDMVLYYSITLVLCQSSIGWWPQGSLLANKNDGPHKKPWSLIPKYYMITIAIAQWGKEISSLSPHPNSTFLSLQWASLEKLLSRLGLPVYRRSNTKVPGESP